MLDVDLMTIFRSEQLLLALANLVLCSALGWACLCRITVMSAKTTAWPVRAAYSVLLMVAIAVGTLVWWSGYWPGWGSVLLAGGQLGVMFAGRHAWRGATKHPARRIGEINAGRRSGDSTEKECEVNSSKQPEPAWLIEARRHIGQREIKGSKHNGLILDWWKAIKRGGIKDDETPWCAAFVGGCLEAVELMSSRFESATSYLKWGVPLDAPEVGCIVVFSRDGGGHVGFVVGRDQAGLLLVLGGNQGDAVSIAAFSRSRVTGYRWPAAVPLPSTTVLPVAQAALSTSEA